MAHVQIRCVLKGTLVTTAFNILSLQRPQSRDTVQAKITFLEFMIYTTLTFNC